MQGPQWSGGKGQGGSERGGEGRWFLCPGAGGPQRSVWPWLLSWLLLHIICLGPGSPQLSNLDSWRVALAPKHGKA